MEIRAGVRGDVEQIAALHTESWRTAYAGIMPSSFLDGPLFEDRLALWHGRILDPQSAAGLFVAVDGGELAGFVYLVPRPDGRVLLDNLHARPGRTGSGIGGRLLRRALAWAAAEHSGRDVYLEVLRANTRAVAFYERHGALRTDERMCRFEQGFDLPELEYTWAAGSVPPASHRVTGQAVSDATTPCGSPLP
ncbi:GNAT family N-acetyltransferase [Streptomyces sp. BV286]|uniref:GNAT family N-acetyltransferase n=1 Tax=Streptomyces sp. BV286 TaxID=2849672 RepID=UPI001C2E3B80|nr:GNAT family N-acetyltransferase [Streptomyces sp. BV286]MBV1941752.1 GNAT family N-acetyltransferase [Streptomyces sp. BV286]